MTDQLTDKATEKEHAKELTKMLRTWVRGYLKNNTPGDPYLAEERWRKMLFPSATKAAVASQLPEH